MVRYQKQMLNYINANGGNAGHYVNKNTIARPKWNLVDDYLNGRITLKQLKQRIGC